MPHLTHLNSSFTVFRSSLVRVPSRRSAWGLCTILLYTAILYILFIPFGVSGEGTLWSTVFEMKTGNDSPRKVCVCICLFLALVKVHCFHGTHGLHTVEGRPPAHNE